jgi:hypothetical protein
VNESKDIVVSKPIPTWFTRYYHVLYMTNFIRDKRKKEKFECIRRKAYVVG